MLRRSKCLRPNQVKNKSLSSYKFQQSNSTLHDIHQPQKTKKSTSIKKSKYKFQNPFCGIEECPTIHLTTEQMQGDILGLLLDLQKQYQKFGAVKLVSSEDWNPPFTFKYLDRGITTRNQILQNLSTGKPFQQNIEAHTLSSFRSISQSFEQKYDNVTKSDGTPFEQNEFQFWQLVSNPKYSEPHVKVEYAADIPTSKYCSAFPIAKQSGSVDNHFKYHESSFNLNNTFKDPNSLLKVCENLKAKISGITQPWVYIGMKFSSFCWHVEDLYMNSLNYNHKGSTKTWYIIPASDQKKMDDYILNKCKYASKGKKQFLHRMTLMINPLKLIEQGIKVYKINQSKKCYVVTFPKAYHCGFSQGFNIGQAVNYSVSDTLSHMVEATNQYRLLNGKKYSVFPVEWLVDQNINQSSFDDKPQLKRIIVAQHQKYISQELHLVKSLVKNKCVKGFSQLQCKKQKYHRNPCATCMQYLYYSMLRCKKCLKIYCLDHPLECCEDEYEIILRKSSKERDQVFEFLKKFYENHS